MLHLKKSDNLERLIVAWERYELISFLSYGLNSRADGTFQPWLAISLGEEKP